MTEQAPVESSETETETESTETEQQQKPTETVEFWKTKAREQERRAKENSKAAERLSELEEAGKSDLEKANGKVTAAETDAADSRAEAIRLRVAIAHGISLEDADLFLTGRDEETLTAQAKRLSEREADRKKNGNKVPAERGNPAATEDEDAATVRSLFGGD